MWSTPPSHPRPNPTPGIQRTTQQIDWLVDFKFTDMRHLHHQQLTPCTMLKGTVVYTKGQESGGSWDTQILHKVINTSIFVQECVYIYIILSPNIIDYRRKHKRTSTESLVLETYLVYFLQNFEKTQNLDNLGLILKIELDNKS